jgi:hypothetical protein
MNLKIKSYIKFSCFSIFFILIIIILFFSWCYPSYYLEVSSWKKILGLVLLVNIGSGSLIGLLVFNSRKISVRFGLSGLALVQLVILMSGIVAIFYTRPVYVVFNVDRFTMVAVDEIPLIEMNKAPQLLVPTTGPQFIAAKFPANYKERERILFSSIDSSVDLAQMPQYYLPYEQFTASVKTRIQPLERLISQQSEEEQPNVKLLLAASLAKRGLLQKDVGYLPLQASAQDMTVLVRRHDAVVIDILPISPW